MYFSFQKNKLLSEVSTYGIGGPAKYYIEVNTVDDMQKVLSFCNNEKLPFFILGKGSNCLFDSRGLNRLVIHNKIDFCTEIQPGHFHVGAGFSFSLLGTQVAKKGWTGLEFASGIPATVGGAVYMNAGAQGQATFDTLSWVDYVSASGELKRYTKDAITYGYRITSFQKMQGAIVSACFVLQPSSEARTNQLALLQKRISSQPYQHKSAGCVFKNPPNTSAGALIDQCGLKGFRIGDAEVSTMHANFLINASSASSHDMRALIEHVQQTVKEKTGIDLHTEVMWVTDP